MSGEPTEQRSTAPNGRLRWTVKMHNTEGRSQSYEVRTHRTVRCATGLSGAARGQMTSMVNRSKPPNGLLTRHTLDNEQCHVRCATGLSGVPIDSNDWNSGWGYKYPQPPPFNLSKPPTLLIQYKSKGKHSKDTIKAFNLPKLQNQLNCLETWERIICVSFVALVAWIAFSFSFSFFLVTHVI
jgi:hypothetical protein